MVFDCTDLILRCCKTRNHLSYPTFDQKCLSYRQLSLRGQRQSTPAVVPVIRAEDNQRFGFIPDPIPLYLSTFVVSVDWNLRLFMVTKHFDPVEMPFSGLIYSIVLISFY